MGLFALSWILALTFAITGPLAADEHAHHKHGHSSSVPRAAVDSAADQSGEGGKTLPNTPLITHEGKTVRFFDDLIKGKVVAINFVFTSCGNSCPLETARLKVVQNLLGDRMGKDTFFYSVSVDPETDTPEVLNAYHKKFNLGPGWKFLTGKKADIDNLQRRLGVYLDEVERKQAENNHTLNIIIGNQKTGHWVKRSNMDNAQVLAHNIERLHPQQPKSNRFQKYEDAPAQITGFSSGQKLFTTRCMDCHTIGGGDGIGPDLLGVTEKRDRRWLMRWIKEPDRMLQEKDPLAVSLFDKYQQIPMPNLQLGDADIKAVIEFLEAEAGTRSKP